METRSKLDSVHTQWKTEGNQWKEANGKFLTRGSESNGDLTNRKEIENVELLPKEYQLAHRSLEPCTFGEKPVSSIRILTSGSSYMGYAELGHIPSRIPPCHARLTEGNSVVTTIVVDGSN